MGQKVNPISNRLGIIRGWDSNWYGGNDYGDSLLEDSKKMCIRDRPSIPPLTGVKGEA